MCPYTSVKVRDDFRQKELQDTTEKAVPQAVNREDAFGVPRSFLSKIWSQHYKGNFNSVAFNLMFKVSRVDI
jgi:hypothetical protein